MTNKIETYIELLKEYNEKTNIYSKKAYDKLEFHINDSLTLANIITNTPIKVVDFGSGSGLPAIIIALTNTKNTVYAIESKSRKTQFLDHIKSKLNLTNLTIIQKNIVEWTRETKLKADVITAKAFGPKEKIHPLAKKISRKHTQLYIPISTSQKEEHPQHQIITKEDFHYLNIPCFT